jgi:hypothetical protein
MLIGKETHSREWVKWKIEEAKKQGKRIAGVHAQGETQLKHLLPLKTTLQRLWVGILRSAATEDGPATASGVKF